MGGKSGIIFEVEPNEFKSPIFGGIKPAFTRVENKKISVNGTKVKGSFDVVTQLSGFEVTGQWIYTFFSGIIQDNIITVRQTINFEFDVKTGEVTITYDGSSFPEHNYKTRIFSKEKKVGDSDNNATLNKKEEKVNLRQSTYEEAVHSEKFKDRGNKQKKTTTTKI